jgi:hypothetical protein
MKKPSLDEKAKVEEEKKNDFDNHTTFGDNYI